MSNMGISRTALDWIIYTDYEEKRGYRYHFLSSISIHVELIVNLLGRRVVSVAALFCRNCDFAVENNDSISSNLTIFNHHTFLLREPKWSLPESRSHKNVRTLLPTLRPLARLKH